ncbi:hypothetical protein [Nodularia sphaerocarpa]|uniref:hypothetical protein n=1 Tax=Nodularia sphaerocarpa TaxID=137816 RepID=UPI001EFA46F9|nr:hypothetical protein [Nodularia sphaerocarpa]MDB9376193.1 hypothetical protein [Nodularia sphaerocarpa CS-585]MDB9377634.1 hypothetical protein [Nodularia sphaerocarpa CS-585A2]ULP74286.1 hypothetical protein BDGGKGIB_03950 [Nodularia sphaerocarpa UHCC 0038]
MPQGLIHTVTFEMTLPSASIHRLPDGVVERFNQTLTTTFTFVSHCGERGSRHKASGGTRFRIFATRVGGSAVVHLTYFAFYICALPLSVF